MNSNCFIMFHWLPDRDFLLFILFIFVGKTGDLQYSHFENYSAEQLWAILHHSCGFFNHAALLTLLLHFLVYIFILSFTSYTIFTEQKTQTIPILSKKKKIFCSFILLLIFVWFDLLILIVNFCLSIMDK